MADFQDAITQHQNLSEEAQKKAGQATGSDMSAQHKRFLAELIGMLDRKEMDARVPASLLKQENYGPLSQEQKDAVDLALMNITDELRLIEDYYRSKETPNASPQLQTMIEHFWDKKTRLEEKYGDVLKF